jgi:hypothetical protein
MGRLNNYASTNTQLPEINIISFTVYQNNFAVFCRGKRHSLWLWCPSINFGLYSTVVHYTDEAVWLSNALLRTRPHNIIFGLKMVFYGFDIYWKM